MFTCASCNSLFTEGPACGVCKQYYDFQCSGITETGYKLEDRKSVWKCSKCKSSPCATPSSQQSSQFDKIQIQLSAIALQLAPLPTLLEDIKTIKSKINGLTDSLEMAHELIDKFSGHLTQRNKALLNKAKNLAKENNFKCIWVRHAKLWPGNLTPHQYFL